MCLAHSVCERESAGSSNPGVMFINFLSLCSFLCWAAEGRKLVREAGKRQRRDPGWEALNSCGGTGTEIRIAKVWIWGRRGNVDTQKRTKKRWGRQNSPWMLCLWAPQARSSHVSLIFTYIGIQMAVRKMKWHWKAALCVQTTLVNKANYWPVSSVRGLGSGLVPMELQPKSNWIRFAPRNV